ncbi:flagellar hook-basal body complex protein [Roseovarius rhodophyticola]|uniref:Flagellar basal-body rod protein FlgF n=1 Tax=Roseovarius rhodophyticola TaxID=3080827 RepID=A0ABZ2TPE7_9RHOB|nr:flagellar hook-basal body complex protein [Roseovarius sp. W115]MDV2929989.1 flagellar hook-basal body complex protein [Roseovarius sp. W115]
MEATGYTTLNRQAGLLREMQTVANNIANSATTGYRAEGIIFSEHVSRTQNGPSLSMATANIGQTSLITGTLTQTGSTLDVAIQGDGFFLIETPNGERLSRAGSFSLSAEGDLVTNDGYRVLDTGGAPIFIPPDAADLGISTDGTISAGKRLLGQLGVVMPDNRDDLIREGGVMFRVEGTFDTVATPQLLQGFLEGSNVNPISEMTRMIEVQRAYEMGQSFLDAEDNRIRDVIKTLTR